MTIHQTASRVQYIGKNSQTEFTVDFRFFTDDNLKVYLDGVLQASGYTVANSGTETGSNVTYATAPALDVVITIERLLDYKQFLDLIEYDRFPAESVEAEFDYVVLLTQQNQAALDRALQAPTTMPEDVDLTIPVPGAGEFFKYTDDGKAIETAKLSDLGDTIIASATDQEITDGTETEDRLMSPAQIKLGVETHETAPITSVFNVAWVQVVDVLPGTPDANTLYLVRQ